MLIDIAADLLFSRCLFFSRGFGPAVKQTVGSSLPLFVLPLDLLARYSKVDDVAHLVPFVPASVIGGSPVQHLGSTSNMPLA